MFTKEEILKGKSCPPELEENLKDLLSKMNQVRSFYGKPMIVTSGFRSTEDQIRIYHEKGITDPAQMHMHSKHFSCLAVDIYDPNGEVHDWCKENESLLVEIGIWLENRQGNWQHFQSVKFSSYRPDQTIWFNP
jgi:hypothetical protein